MAIESAAKPKRRKRRAENLPAPETIRQMLAELEAELQRLRNQ